MFSRLSSISFLAFVSLSVAQADFQVTVKPFSSSVPSIEDIGFSVIVTNPTDKDVRVISKNNILDEAPTTSFAVKKDGQEVLFTGIRVTYNFEHESNYMTIPAFGSVTVNHTNLAALYDFQSHGTGAFTFIPKTNFRSSTDDPLAQAKVELDPVTVNVTTDVRARALFDGVDTLASTPSCNDGNKNTVLVNALADARALAGAARDNVGTGAYGEFFGNNNPDDVAYRFDMIAGDYAGDRQIHCNEDPAGICNGGVVAYCMLALSGGNIVSSDIYNCDYFFDRIQDSGALCSQPVENIGNSKGGVELHELSHATAATDDHLYGCQAVKGLNDQEKFTNADNYQCFALHVFRTQRC